MRRIMGYTAVILATLLLIQGLSQFGQLLQLFLLSLFVAAAIRPSVAWLTERGLKQAAARALFYIVAIGATVLAVVLLGNLLLFELNRAANFGVMHYEGLQRTWRDGPLWQRMIGQMLPALFTPDGTGAEELAQLLPRLRDLTVGVTTVITSLVLVLAMSIYWSSDQYRMERLWLSLLPVKRRAYARDSWREIETAVGGYLRSQAIQSFLAAVLLGLGALIAGSDYPLTMALLGALAAFIPLVGGIGAAVVAFGLGNLNGSGTAIVLAVLTAAVFLALELVVAPRLRLQERRSFLLTILTIILLVEMYGLWGLIVAPPLAVALHIIIRLTFQTYIARRDTVVQLADLETRHAELTASVAVLEDADAEVTPELQSFMQRLARLLAESRELPVAEL